MGTLKNEDTIVFLNFLELFTSPFARKWGYREA